MSQTSCKRCGFPIPTRWFRAGGDLSRPNSIHQCTDRTLMRSEHQSKCLPYSPDLACVQTCRWRRPGVPPIIGIGAGIKSP
jgi:hypothetical protein